MRRRRWQQLAVLVIILGAVIAGCAKRPEMLQASAPAPTGAAITQAPAPASPALQAPTPPPPTPPLAAAPAPAPPAPALFRTVMALKEIHFDFDKYDIRPDAARTLGANLDWIQSNSEALILIEGHCDERGTDEYNLALGDRRARATMNYLVAHGVSANRVTIISYGKERPLCAERTEACWARNRRAHFLAKVR